MPSSLHPQLVEITPESHHVQIQLAYATHDNITGQPIYQKKACYLHKKAELCLKKAVIIADTLNLRLKIFDAFRPLEAQMTLWKHFEDPNYISHPEEGSTPHCRGVAVDLTLIDAEGNELEMGTAFDHLGKESHHSYLTLSPTAISNRMLLLGIMTAAGWDYYENEWWHYQLHHARDYEKLTDITAGTKLIPR